MVAIGKEGTIFLLNRDNMGHFCSSCTKDAQIVEEIPNFAPETGALFYWNNAIYTSGAGSPIKVLGLNKGLLSRTAIAQSKLTTQGLADYLSGRNYRSGFLADEWAVSGGL
jgi:hypothetical protein